MRTAKGAEAIFASGTTATLLTEQTSNEDARFSSGRCLRHRRRDVLRAAWRLITHFYAGLCCGLNANSHVARLRRRHRRCLDVRFGALGEKFFYQIERTRLRGIVQRRSARAVGDIGIGASID